MINEAVTLLKMAHVNMDSLLLSPMKETQSQQSGTLELDRNKMLDW